MIPVLYAPEEKSFNSLGLGSLTDCISCVVEEERNGKYELTMKYPHDGIHFSEIQHSSIIKVRPYDGGTLQLFRVYQITAPLDMICTVYAEHISYQLNHIPVMPYKAYTVRDALENIKRYSTEENPFTFWTDVSSSAEFIQGSPGIARNCLGGREGSILDVYGGEFEWDNFTVKLHQERGEDRDVTLRYGKNITDLSQEESIAGTYTGLVPFWIGEVIDEEAKEALEEEAESLETSLESLDDDIEAQTAAVNRAKTAYTNAKNKYGANSAQAKKKKKAWQNKKAALGKLKNAKENNAARLDNIEKEIDSVESAKFEVCVTLPEKTLYADDAEEFPYQRVRTLDLSDKFDDRPTEGELRDMAQSWMDANDFGEPDVNLKVSFVPLWDTEEYKDVAPLERVRLCDIVTVEFERLGIRVAAKVTAYKYNVLVERYESITLGKKNSFTNTISDQFQLEMDTLEEIPTTINSVIQAEVDRATELIRGGYGGYVVYHANGNGQPDEILIMDAPNVADAVNVIRINKNGIGFSQTGYEGPFRSAWTIDGHFVADFITSGTLNAGVIKAGTIEDVNHTNYWNLETGEFRLSLNTKVGDGTETLKSLEDQAAEAFDAANSAASAAATAQSTANSAASSATSAYNKAQGIITDASTGNMYISAACIQGGTIEGITLKSVYGSRQVRIANGEIEFYYGNISAAYIEAFEAGAGIYGLRIKNNWPIQIESGNSNLQLHAPIINIGTASSVVYSEGIRKHDASSTTANIRINVDTGKMMIIPSGSSRRYKHDIKPIVDTELDPHKLYELPVIQFVYNEDRFSKEDPRYNKIIPGFIAEDIEKIYPIACDYENPGIPEDWIPKHIIPPMLALIQEQHKEIEGLKAEISELKTQMQKILTKIGE